MRLKRLPRINGRRGAFQFLFGVAFGMLAAAKFDSVDYPPALQWIDQYIPEPGTLAVVWAVPALLAVIGSFLPRPKDWFSFAALAAAPSAWGCLYLIGSILQPHGTSPFGVVLYWAIAGAVMVVAGMTGDRDRDHREVDVL